MEKKYEFSGETLEVGEELIRRAYADNSRSGREYARIVKYVESIKSEIDK